MEAGIFVYIVSLCSTFWAPDYLGNNAMAKEVRRNDWG
jgi:hypothetical protein